MKYEWKKAEKNIYLPKNQPEIIKNLDFNYFTIEGSGNPNSKPFQENLKILYGYAYTIRMLHKKNRQPDDFFEYTVYPLEGFWTSKTKPKEGEMVNKEELIYKIMIRQPEFVNKNLLKNIEDLLNSKFTKEQMEKVKLERIKEENSLQIMHFGSYDTEIESFNKLEEYAKQNNIDLVLDGWHKEVYIGDPRKSKDEKLRTILRLKIK